MSRQKAIEAALRRRSGATPEHAQKVREHMRAQHDLYTVCPACGLRRSGAFDAVTAACPRCA